MNIQKYTGKNEQEIMRKIKDELGSSAIILNIRTIKSKGFMGLFKKDVIEITAATDMEATQKSTDQIPLKSKIEEPYEPPISEKKPYTTKSKIENLIYNHLIDQEVEEEVARHLLEGTNVLSEDCDIQEVIRIVYHNISKAIGTPEIIEDSASTEADPKVIFFIGPTGVGKTTSIAKLTADFSLRKQKKISLITADTYRIAAIDQLRTYAEILLVPLKVIYSTKELFEGIEEFKESDMIFIDTAGRSHKNGEQLQELKEMLNMFPDKKVYLVLSATTKFKDVISIANKYSDICDKYAIIVTKTDETTSIGTILNLRYYIDKSLSYISFGQNVPDDIEIIDGGKYAKMLLGSLGNE